jgi:type II secretory pathway pseudopilin PulG
MNTNRSHPSGLADGFSSAMATVRRTAGMRRRSAFSLPELLAGAAVAAVVATAASSLLTTGTRRQANAMHRIASLAEAHRVLEDFGSAARNAHRVVATPTGSVSSGKTRLVLTRDPVETGGRTSTVTFEITGNRLVRIGGQAGTTQVVVSQHVEQLEFRVGVVADDGTLEFRDADQWSPLEIAEACAVEIRLVLNDGNGQTEETATFVLRTPGNVVSAVPPVSTFPGRERRT